MHKLYRDLYGSQLFKFALEAHANAFPAFAWKAVACDAMRIPMGSRPTVGQMVNQPCSWSHLWLNLTLRFDQMTSVRWAEHLENEEERIFNALQYLGTTSEKVSQTLQLMGVMGDVMESRDCPMAHYFHGVYGAWFADISIVNSQIDFVTCANPGHICKMLRDFDNDRHPDLNLFSKSRAVL